MSYLYKDQKLFLFFCCISLFSCNSSKVIVDLQLPFQIECLNREGFEAANYPTALSHKQYKPALVAKFSPQSLIVANAIGVLDDLDALVTHYEATRIDTLQLLFLRQGLSDKINQSVLEVSSLTAAIDCEGEKSEQVANFIERETRKKERNLTVAAIVVGAAVSMAAGGVLLLQGADLITELVGITGGLTEVWLGLSILRTEKKVYIPHENNILAEVQNNAPVTDFIPPAVWYFINHQNAEMEGKSLRMLLLERWEMFNIESRDRAVLFEDGGIYTAHMLKNRAEMLHQLEAQIDLMQQSLLGLSKEINQF